MLHQLLLCHFPFKLNVTDYEQKKNVIVIRGLTPPIYSVPDLRFLVTALFTNMRILKFKSQLKIAFSAAVNHLSRPLRKQNFTLTGSKGHGL